MAEKKEYEDFSSASEAALGLLREKVGVRFWMVTRIEGKDLIVLSTVGDGVTIKNGDVFPWADSLCSRMISGDGPRVAPDISKVDWYASARMTQQFNLGAYIGAPLMQTDGKPYGTLCGLDREKRPDDLMSQQWLVEMVAGLLSAILAREKDSSDNALKIDPSVGEGGVLVDPLTQLFNRRAWERILTAEEARCARHGHSACVIVVDIDGLAQINAARGRDAGDRVILQTAQILKRACRGYDIAARTGESELAVLAVECGLKGAKGIFDRVNAGLQKENIKGTLGLALRNASTGLPRTFEEATNTLTNAKRQR